MRVYYVYNLSNASRMLYTGVTNDLIRRMHEHKSKKVPGFTAWYNLHRLVYVESTADIRAAIAREKQIKGWTRARKIELIRQQNPRWCDLARRLTDPELIPAGFVAPPRWDKHPRRLDKIE